MSNRGLRRFVLVGILVAITVAALVGGAFVLTQTHPTPRRTRLPAGLTAVGPANETVEVPRRPVDVGQSPDLGSPDMAPVPDGCGQAQNSGTWEHRARNSSYLLHVPKNYDPQHPHPFMIVLFSEQLRSVTSFLRDSGLEELADAEGLVLIAPLTSSPGVVTQVVDSVEDASSRVCLDQRRRYAVGFGGGGRDARELRCVLPLSAIAVVSSGQRVEAIVCQAPPTPVIRFFGLTDRRVPVEGGQGCYSGPYLAARKVEAEWASRNECEGRPRRYFKYKKSNCRIWTCSASVAICELDGGHDWPGAEASVDIPGCAGRAPDFPMTPTIWRFFEEHGRLLP